MLPYKFAVQGRRKFLRLLASTFNSIDINRAYYLNIQNSVNVFRTKYPCVLLSISNRFSIEDKICWNCGKSIGSASLVVNFCPSCNFIQPLNERLTFFEVLEVETTFDIDKKRIINSYRRLQSFFHPDKYSNATDEEKQVAESNSSTVNEAYKTLLHPVERALYFLSLHGKPLEGGEISMEAKFLMEIMETNEKLEDAEDGETLREISEMNNNIMDSLLRETSIAFSKTDFDAAKILVARIKYYNNINEKIKQKELEFGILH